jgi:hypothetical protein
MQGEGSQQNCHCRLPRRLSHHVQGREDKAPHIIDLGIRLRIRTNDTKLRKLLKNNKYYWYFGITGKYPYLTHIEIVSTLFYQKKIDHTT